MFVGVSSQNNSFWKTNKYSGGYKSGLSGSSINEYNVSIPVSWVLESTAPKNTTPLNVTVNFIFNKGAITESIGYKILKPISENYRKEAGKFYLHQRIPIHPHQILTLRSWILTYKSHRQSRTQ